MKKKIKRQLIIFIILLVIVALSFILDKYVIYNIQNFLYNEKTYGDNQTEKNNGSNKIDETLYEVIRVVDGDTFVINYNGVNERVRLIGIDTPESVHPDDEKNTEFGVKVSNYSKEMLTGKNVMIELDVQKRDQYGRLLAYIYLDGQMYNKILLEKGFAKLATYPPNVKYVNEFIQIQKQARENGVGLWAY